MIKSEAETRKAAVAAGLKPGQVKNNLSTQTIAGAKGALKAGQTPLVSITLTGNSPKKVAVATTVLGQDIIDQRSGFVDQKIASFKELDASLTQQLASNQRQIEAAQAALRGAGNLTPLEQLVLQRDPQRSGSAERTAADPADGRTAAVLSQAEDVEKPQFVDRPVPVKTTARSTRNSMLVGGAIGLIVGIIAALAWGPVARRVNKEA